MLANDVTQGRTGRLRKDLANLIKGDARDDPATQRRAERTGATRGLQNLACRSRFRCLAHL